MWLQKVEEADEHDGRIVAVLRQEVRAGDELCNSYVDSELPYEAVRRPTTLHPKLYPYPYP